MTLRAPDERCRRGELLLSMLPGVSSAPFCLPQEWLLSWCPRSEFSLEREPAFHWTDSSLGSFGRRLPGERESYNPRNLAVLLYFLPEGLIFPDANQALQCTAAWKQTRFFLFLEWKRGTSLQILILRVPPVGTTSALETRCVASGVQRPGNSLTSKSSASSLLSIGGIPGRRHDRHVSFSLCFSHRGQRSQALRLGDSLDLQLCALGQVA